MEKQPEKGHRGGDSNKLYKTHKSMIGGKIAPGNDRKGARQRGANKGLVQQSDITVKRKK